MPPTIDPINEKEPFDVYGMMVILSFVFTLGAVLVLNQELTTNWGARNFLMFGDEHKPVPIHVTQLNRDPKKRADIIDLRKEDKDDWKLALKNREGSDRLPVSNFEWPAGFDPLENPVLPDQDNLTKIPKAQLDALMAGVGVAPEKKSETPAAEVPPAEKAAEPVKTPDAKPAETPAEPEKK